MPLSPADGQMVLDEIGLAIGRLGGWILRTGFTPVFEHGGGTLRPAAVMPGLLISHDHASTGALPIGCPLRHAVSRLHAELCRINAVHVGAPGLCVIDGFDAAWSETETEPEARLATGKGRTLAPHEFRRFGRVLPPADPFALPKPAPAGPYGGAPDIVRLDIRLLGSLPRSAVRDLLAGYRARALDILLAGVADARLLEQALELGGLLSGSHLGIARPAGAEIDTTPRPLHDLLGSQNLIAFRPRAKEPIKAPDRRVQNL